MRFKAFYFVLCVSGTSLPSLADTNFKNELNLYLEAGRSSNIEHVGNGLIAELEKRKPQFLHCSHQEFNIDALAPIGDGKASNHIVIKCKGFSDLGIRFSFSSAGKYRIFGYWSLKS